MTLTEGFQLLATAPDGVARLRELVLSLAMTGKLVPQDPNDEPASDLLRRIRDGKPLSIAKAERNEPLDKSANGGWAEELPEGWESIRFGEVWDHSFYGPRFSNDDYIDAGGIPTVRTTDMSGGRIILNNAPRVRIPAGKRDTYLLKRGDLLVTRSGSIGVMALFDLDLDAIPSAYLIRIRLVQHVLPKYCLLFLTSPYGQRLMGLSTTSVGVPNVNATKMASFVVPLPPRAEQLRIVAKVDELMHLCDELETRGRLEAEQHARLTTTLFDALAGSESSHALAENWSRVAAHFDLLLDRPEAVDALEQTILQLAVRGLLVPQKPDDEPAGAVLLEVATKRDRLFAKDKMGRNKKAPSEGGDEPISAPRAGWELVTFPDLCVVGGGATPSKAKAAYWDGKLPWVSPKDMKVEYISDAQDHVSELALQETRLPLVPERSLLIVVRGMILAHSFPVGITQVAVTINQDMKSLTPIVPALVPYLALVCRGFKREILELVDRSTHGTCKLQSDKLFAFRFGLPPLAEQSRILARVEELRHLCENLRTHLTARQTCQARFAEALVGQAASATPLIAHTDDLAAAA